MGVKRQTQRAVAAGFPPDFPERLECFKEEAGLSWRSLASKLGVKPYRVREWRRGTVPSGPHLFALLTLAATMDLRDGVLMCAERDVARATDARAAATSTTPGSE